MTIAEGYLNRSFELPGGSGADVLSVPEKYVLVDGDTLLVTVSVHVTALSVSAASSATWARTESASSESPAVAAVCSSRSRSS